MQYIVVSAINIENLTVEYQSGSSKFTCFKNFNLTVNDGEFVCVLGESGCGKSSLLNAVAGLIKPSNGSIKIDDKTIDGPGRDRSVVFQHYSLFPWLSARKNVIFGIKHGVKKVDKVKCGEIADYYLKEVGLEHAKDKYPAQLSGGMQQRVAIARAMATDSSILLMDEPFGAIDPKIRVELQNLVSKLCKEYKKTVIFITHDIEESIILADRIIFLKPNNSYENIDVKLEKNQARSNLLSSREYKNLHDKLISLFYDSFEWVI